MVSFTLEVTGGTASIDLGNTSSSDGGGASYNSFQLTNFSSGITSLCLTVTYSNLIAGRTFDPSSVSRTPMLTALGLSDLGTGDAFGNYDVTADYSGFQTVIGGVASSGLPAGAIPLASADWDNPATPGATSFTASSGFAGMVPNSGGSSSNFLLVKGYDVGGAAGYDSSDSPKVYADTVKYTIDADGANSFTTDTRFIISLDGQQFSTIMSVPEPTVPLLSVICSFGLFMRRSRS